MSQSDTPASIRKRNIYPDDLALTAADILDQLESIWCRRPDNTLLLREVPLDAGRRGQSKYRIDALRVDFRSCRQCMLTAYEVKVSRADFMAEIENPEKRLRAMQIAEQFFFVAPLGLIDPEEVPEDCGLIGARAGCAPVRVKGATDRPRPDLTWELVTDLLRRAVAFGQQHTAKRSSLAGVPEAFWLAEAVANPFADYSERDFALYEFQRWLRLNGRNDEAREVNSLRRDLDYFTPYREMEPLELSTGILGFSA